MLPRVLVLTLKRYSSDHCKTMDPIVISPSIDLESLVVKATAGDSCVRCVLGKFFPGKLFFRIFLVS